MIGLGLNFQKIKKAKVDRLFDDLNISSQLIFCPYKQVLKNFTSNIIRLVRSDLEELEFGFTNGVLNQSDIISWGGSNIYVKRVYLQNDDSKYFYQNDFNYMPKLVNDGVFQDDGLLFDGSNDRLALDTYSDLNMVSPVISIYSHYKRNSSHIGFIFCKNDVGSDDVQYSLLNDGVNISGWWNGNQRIIASNQESNQDLICWQSTVANGLKLNTNGGESSALFNATLTNVDNITIGARKNPTSHSTFFNGNIKSVILCNNNIYDKYTQLSNNI